MRKAKYPLTYSQPKDDAIAHPYYFNRKMKRITTILFLGFAACAYQSMRTQISDVEALANHNTLVKQGIVIGETLINVEKSLGKPIRYEYSETGDSFAIYTLRSETKKTIEVSSIYVADAAGLGTNVLPTLVPDEKIITYQLETTYAGVSKRIKKLSFFTLE